MGCSNSDGEAYRKGDKEGMRREKGLVWERLDPAKAFFAELTQPDCGELQAVKGALSALESQEGATANVKEKMAVLALAWQLWMEDEKVTPVSLSLESYIVCDGNGRPKLVNPPVFGNLDLGPSPDLTPPVDVKKEAAKEREEAARQAAEKEEAAKNGESDSSSKEVRKATSTSENNPNTGRDAKELDDVRKEHPGVVLLFRGSKLLNVWNGDIDTVTKVFTSKPIRVGTEGELRVASWPIDRTAEIVVALKEGGDKVGVVTKHKTGGMMVEIR
jgi:hypothetical protein